MEKASELPLCSSKEMKESKKTASRRFHGQRVAQQDVAFGSGVIVNDLIGDPEDVYEGVDDEQDIHFDELEVQLMNEGFYNGGSSAAASSSSAGDGYRGRGKINLGSKVQNEISSSERKATKRTSYYGRDDRATSEQVLDPRTRLILFKLLNSGFLSEIDGCLSTGKEANVYYARGSDGSNREYAVKIFKTSILVFKDRDRYTFCQLPLSSHHTSFRHFLPLYAFIWLFLNTSV